MAQSAAVFIMNCTLMYLENTPRLAS